MNREARFTTLFDARDADGDDIITAEIGFTSPQQYREEEDFFLFDNMLGIVGSFNESLGILTLTGKASVQDYVTAIRSVRYNHIVVEGAEPLNEEDQNRKVYIKLKDSPAAEPGAFGGTKERIVGLVSTFQELNIANAFTPTGAVPFWNIYSPNGLTRYKDALIRVYNKRGTLVYEAKGFGTPWNGDGLNGALPADSYFYTIDLKYDKKKYKGVVTILR